MDRSFGARCDISRHDWRIPPKPRSCRLDFGQGVTVGSHGRAHFVCAGDSFSEASVDRLLNSLASSRLRIAKPRLLARVLVTELEKARQEGAASRRSI